jgi:DNA-binding NarL/FixJ family response regulator
MGGPDMVLETLDPAVRHQRFELLQRQFYDQVRRFGQSVRLYNSSMARGRRQPNGVHDASTLTIGLGHAPVAAATAANGLTARQIEIAALITRGYTNQQIADALVVTQGTVANHVRAILERLDLRSRTQIAVWYARRPPPASPNRTSRTAR